jgi:nucleotide-binding universal stress UspA family protein
VDMTTVVAWDDTPSAAAALEWALAREGLRGGAVELVHVVDDADRRHATAHDHETASRAADAAADRARAARPGCPVSVDIRRGEPLDELVRLTRPGTVVAIGTHPRSGRLRRGWSLGARLAAASAGPVAIIPAEPATGRTGVVAGYDGTPEAVAALDFAAAEAGLRRQHLHIVHAWLEPVLLEGQPAAHPQLIEMLEEESEQILAGAVERVAADFPSLPVQAHAVHGPPATALLHAGASATLLVVGSRGLVGMRRILLGSVSHDLVVGVECATVVVGHAVHPPRG